MNRPKTRNMSKENDEFMKFVEYIDKKFEEMQDNFTKNLKDDLLKEITSLVEKQNAEIIELKESVLTQESTIKVLQGNVAGLKASNESMLERLNQLEQYSRRQSLRIDGIENNPTESNDDVIKIVKECFNEAEVTIPDIVIDRAHRVGPKYKTWDGKVCRSVIVKFSNFRKRTEFYDNRRKLKNGKKVKIDLTKKNYQLLKETRVLIGNTKPDNVKEDYLYVFADVNCRLKIVNKDSNESIFIGSIDDVQDFLCV